MSQDGFRLFVLLLGIIGPMVLAAQVLYLTRKDKTGKKQWQKMRHMAIALLGGSIALFIGLLLVGYDVSYAFSSVFPYLLLLVNVYPTTWLILMYVEKRRTPQKT